MLYYSLAVCCLGLIQISLTSSVDLAEVTVRNFLLLLESILYGVTKSSVTVLMVYTSLVIRQRLMGINIIFNKQLNFFYYLSEMTEQIKNNSSTHNFKVMRVTVCEMEKNTNKLNSLLSWILIVKIFANGIFLLSGLCGLAEHFIDGLPLAKEAIMAKTCYVMISLLDLFFACHSSHKIIASMGGLRRAIASKLFMEEVEKSVDILQMQKILKYGKSLKLRAFDLFDLNYKTIVVIAFYASLSSLILIKQAIDPFLLLSVLLFKSYLLS
jgi:hypothetical protein